jgi:hypothetical protein
MIDTHSPKRVAAWSDMAAAIGRGMLAAAAVLTVVVPSSVSLGRIDASYLAHMSTPSAISATEPRLANFGVETPSPEARHVADWVADSRDTAGSAFLIVDKKYARIYVFDDESRLRGTAPVLLGSAMGDDSVPGIGSRAIADVLPQERTTPAGRFVAERGHNARGEDVVWVDYDGAVSIHRVLSTNAEERRLERLATAAVDDNRISYGCINVPVAFYEVYIRPIFAKRRAIVYVLPEVKSVQQVFGSYDVALARSVVIPSAIAASTD